MSLTDPVLDAFEKSQAEHHARVATKLERLKAGVLAAMLKLAIAHVEICFDGCSDSGAVEDINCRNSADDDVDLPEDAVIPVENHEAQAGEMSLRNALENLAYAALELHHPGWENNDGAYGALELDAATGKVTLDCKLRYTAYEDCFNEI